LIVSEQYGSTAPPRRVVDEADVEGVAFIPWVALGVSPLAATDNLSIP
jgi:hypothetical protein